MKKVRINGGILSRKEEHELRLKARREIAAHEAHVKHCPACSGTGNIHKNCILR